MDLPVGSTSMAKSSNIPGFLTKLWTLVSDPDTDALIRWSPSGNSFHVFNQDQFAKNVLPNYFKHNNMASFVRQLNMYGFRKVVHLEQEGLLKSKWDDIEFQHPCFLRNQKQLLENIKRKVTSVSTLKSTDLKNHLDSVAKLWTDMQLMKQKQESMNTKVLAMMQENQALWREVASLQQKYAQQQKVVNELIQCLMLPVQSNQLLGLKRKIPSMLSDCSSAHSTPKYSPQYSLKHDHGRTPYPAPAPASSTSDVVNSSGSTISNITPSSPLVPVKDGPLSPPRRPWVEEVSLVNSSSSLNAFIDSILRESESTPTITSTTPVDTSRGCATTSPSPSTSEKYLDVTYLDKNKLSDQLDGMDANLDNLQTMLTSHFLDMDTSTLVNTFSPSTPISDMSLPDLASRLASIQKLLSPQESPRPMEAENNNPESGKQLETPPTNPGSSEPLLFELGEGSNFSKEDSFMEGSIISLQMSSEPTKAENPTVS